MNTKANQPALTCLSMQTTLLLALAPTCFIAWLFFGQVFLLQWILLSLSAIAIEGLSLLIKKQPLNDKLNYLNSLTYAWIFLLCLPAHFPLWGLILSFVCALVVAKQLYGGFGFNLFHPAMLACALLSLGSPSLLDNQVGASFEWVNLTLFLAGLYLIHKKVIPSLGPIAFLISLIVINSLIYTPEHYLGPVLQILSGPTMLIAFFIVTDPITGVNNKFGQILYAVGTAILFYCLTYYGTYPQSLGFAILLMNAIAPIIQLITQPKVTRKKSSLIAKSSK